MINVYLKDGIEIYQEYIKRKLQNEKEKKQDEEVKICKTYIKENGKRIDCNELNEDRIIDLIEQDFDSLNQDKKIKNKAKNNATISQFVSSINPTYKASYEGVLRLLQIRDKYNQNCSHITSIMANLDSVVGKIEQAKCVVAYQKQLVKDDSKISMEELISALKNLALLEKNQSISRLNKELEMM